MLAGQPLPSIVGAGLVPALHSTWPANEGERIHEVGRSLGLPLQDGYLCEGVSMWSNIFRFIRQTTF